ncbi:MAG: hypothetical protein B6I24_04925 [Bacteroidetes bacterium 4572_128]|nr:MAG: hypothetical protein B6I24_04925 [Bacteroidetes bacterium 4572_128]
MYLKIYSLSIENLTNFNMEVLNFFSFGSFKNLNNLKKEIEYQELVKKLKKREEYQIFDKIKEENEKIIIGKNVSKKSKVKNSKNTEDYHIKKTNENLKNLYQKLRKNILAFDRNIEIFYRKLYISFKINNRSFLSVIFLKKSLKVIFGKKEIKIYDTKKICKDISEKGHWGTGDYQFHIEDEKDFDYKFNLIKNFFDFVKTKKK